MKYISGVSLLLLLSFASTASAIEPIVQAVVGDTTITLNPATPAPGELFTFTVRGSWSDSCVPRFQVVTGSGNTIQINALANANCTQVCTTAVTPYAFN